MTAMSSILRALFILLGHLPLPLLHGLGVLVGTALGAGCAGVLSYFAPKAARLLGA